MVTRCVMAYPCLQSLVMCGDRFKHNWNTFCQKQKYISKHIVYELKYFSIFTMMPLLLMLMTTGNIQKMCCVSMNNSQTKIFGNVYHFTFSLQQTNMNPRSNCRTSILEEEFKFKYVRRDMYIHIATQNNIWTVKVALCLVM